MALFLYGIMLQLEKWIHHLVPPFMVSHHTCTTFKVTAQHRQL
jgi:hypothetical protein